MKRGYKILGVGVLAVSCSFGGFVGGIEYTINNMASMFSDKSVVSDRDVVPISVSYDPLVEPSGRLDGRIGFTKLNGPDRKRLFEMAMNRDYKDFRCTLDSVGGVEYSVVNENGVWYLEEINEVDGELVGN
tara:strand:+ start:9215 stop:9607 length:393 start_codon:yes stop_codon:yes gene_type:complete